MTFPVMETKAQTKAQNRRRAQTALKIEIKVFHLFMKDFNEIFSTQQHKTTFSVGNHKQHNNPTRDRPKRPAPSGAGQVCYHVSVHATHVYAFVVSVLVAPLLLCDGDLCVCSCAVVK